MANEISSVDSLIASKNGLSVQISTVTQRSLAGMGMHSQEMKFTTGASRQIVWPADLTTEGITEVQIKNLSAVNYVSLGGAVDGTPNITGTKFKILPGQSIKFAPSSGNPTLYVEDHIGEASVVIVAVGT